MQYQEVIAMLPSVQASRNPHKALEDCVELVLAHQTYGSKAGSEENDRAVRYLLAKYQDRSFYLVFDFDIDKTRSSITSAVQNFVKEKYRYDRPVRYASVLARLRADTKCSEEVPDSRLELIEVLPRCFPLLVGTPGFMTQGKAGNQLGALRFSRGHFLQMMDANMGAFLGEASKVPFILRRFQPHWNMNVVDNFSFYFASVGFYFNNLLIDISATVYVFLFILLALCSKSLTDVASLDSMLATEWTLSMGTIAMFPRFMELTLEYGPLEGLLRFLPSAWSPANTHYSWKECYFIHCASHYYPALKVFISYYAYVLVSQAMGFSTLPMMVLLATSSMWLIAPVLFCPQPTLWEAKNEQDDTAFSCFQRACFLLCETCCLVFLLAVMYSSLIDNYFLVVLLYGIHFVLMEVWRLLNRPTVITLLTTLMWLIVPVLTDVPMLDMLVLLTIAILALRVFRSLALLTAWLLLRPNLDWKQMPERSETERSAKQAAARTMHRYDMVVEYLYVNMMGHQLHLYAAVAILLINLVVQSILVLLDASYGLHSWALLNSRLRSRTCCQRRRGFEP
eukprot:g10423.t1